MAELPENPALSEDKCTNLGTHSSPDAQDDVTPKDESTLCVKPLATTPASVKKPSDPSLRHVKVDVDLMISNWSLESEEMPCLVGEKLPSSDSDENYGSYDPTPGSKCSNTLKQVKRGKPWIQTVRGTTRQERGFSARTLNAATMEAWVADGSDDSLQNSPEDDMEQLLSLDEEESDMEEFKATINLEIPCDMEEFKETTNLVSQCDKENSCPTIDLLTGDDTASQDSNACPEPIVCNKSEKENVAGDKHYEENKSNAETLSRIQIENYDKESIEYLSKLMNQQPCPPNTEKLSNVENDGGIQNCDAGIVKETNDTKMEAKLIPKKHHVDSETNCFKVDCKHHLDCIECGIQKIGIEYGIRNGCDDTNDMDVNKIFAKGCRRATDTTENADSNEIKTLISKLESTSQIIQKINTTEDPLSSPDGKTNGNGPQCTSTDTVISLNAMQEIQTENLQSLDSIASSLHKLEESFEESRESQTKEDVKSLRKPKKRVTFADEKELKKQFQSMEPMIAKHEPDSKEIQETQPDLFTALRFMTEVYPNRDDEDVLSDTMITESISLPRSRKESPKAAEIYEELEIIQLDDNKDMLKNSVTQQKSPKRTDNQDSTMKQDLKPTEKSNGKFSKFCKSFKKKIGKIL